MCVEWIERGEGETVCMKRIFKERGGRERVCVEWIKRGEGGRERESVCVEGMKRGEGVVCM